MSPGMCSEHCQSQGLYSQVYMAGTQDMGVAMIPRIQQRMDAGNAGCAPDAPDGRSPTLLALPLAVAAQPMPAIDCRLSALTTEHGPK